MNTWKRYVNPNAVSGSFFRRKQRLIYDAAGQFHKNTQIIREHVEKHIALPLINQTFITKSFRLTKVRQELSRFVSGELDKYIQIKLKHFRSKPSHAIQLLRQTTGQLIYHLENLIAARQETVKPPAPAPPQTVIVREEFHITNRLIHEISREAADVLLRRLELERIRKGIIGGDFY